MLESIILITVLSVALIIPLKKTGMGVGDGMCTSIDGLEGDAGMGGDGSGPIDGGAGAPDQSRNLNYHLYDGPNGYECFMATLCGGAAVGESCDPQDSQPP